MRVRVQVKYIQEERYRRDMTVRESARSMRVPCKNGVCGKVIMRQRDDDVLERSTLRE